MSCIGSGQFKILHTELEISDLYSKKSFSKESQHLLEFVTKLILHAYEWY